MPPRRIVEKEKAVKRALLGQLRESGVPLETVREWLWEDFGKRVKGGWDRVERTILGDSDITPQDVAVFMIEAGVQPEEGAWDAEPVTGLRGPRGGTRRG